MKYKLVAKKFICKKCNHEITLYTDTDIKKPAVCNICKNKELKEDKKGG